jgi:hypothetical protein
MGRRSRQASPCSTTNFHKGFGVLFSSREAAEAHLGDKVHPAPLGNISKEKPDGKTKHRLIQDLRMNSVNAAVTLRERQVLPRPIDHARNMGLLLENMRAGEVLTTLVLDFKDAFMSIPLHKDEMRFNCAEVGEGLTRERAEVFPGEAKTGTLMVWRVLGFGGKPNPLIYSRAASFAMRTAQAIFNFPARNLQVRHLSRARGQLYVDDPAWVLASREQDHLRSIDVLLMWWLALGIPLSWSKGALYSTQPPPPPPIRGSESSTHWERDTK